MTSSSDSHLLVIANETVASSALVEAVRQIARSRDTDVLVVAPAFNSRLRHYMSDSDGARHAARLRLAECVAALRRAGVRAHGEIGDADPLLAIEDAMGMVAVDEIIIGTHPEHRSNWLARDLIARACERFGVPVVHVVAHDTVEHRAAA
jgi:GNAT superfamily N-acetyltransferase